jgi:hypothetical protein
LLYGLCVGCEAHSQAGQYRPREPRDTALHQVMCGYLETFLAECSRDEHFLPAHVVGELRRFCLCGIYAAGFCRLVCESCGAEKVVATSCKGRGFCPSCIGRRMNESAALLVDHVLPDVPVRQFVLTLPIEIRYRVSYDGALCSAVLAVFLRAVMGWYRRQAEAMGYPGGRTGAVTVVQRASSDLRVNPHFHTVVLDGVYLEPGDDQALSFIETPKPTDADIKQLTENVAQRVIRLLLRRGVLDDSVVDPLQEEEPVLSTLLQASVRGVNAVGERAGQRIRRVLGGPAAGHRTGDLCYASRGFTLHAARSIRRGKKDQREALLRYILRPPLANNRLRWLDDKKLQLTLKRPWSDGTSALNFDPLALLGRLAALVPPKGFNGTRYHGCLAPRSALRALIIPRPAEPAASQEVTQTIANSAPAAEQIRSARPRRIAWAALLARVFLVDVLTCTSCGERMKLVAVVQDPLETARYLHHVGLPAELPHIAQARAPPQVEMEFGGG